MQRRPRVLLVEALEERLTPSAGVQEQYLLSLINRFRSDPATELSVLLNSTDPNVQSDLAKFGVDQTALVTQWANLESAPPLAWNDALAAAALAHSQAMLAAGSSASQLPGEPNPATRMANAGYANATLTAENIDAFARSLLEADAALVLDWASNPPTGIKSPPSDRTNLINPSLREVGVGLANAAAGSSVGPILVTEDFGTSSSQLSPYVLGTVIDDLDHDGSYSPGEGLGGINITLVGTGGVYQTTTTAAGGYQIQVLPGEYTITAEGGGLAAPLTKSITVFNDNFEVDFMRPLVPPPAINSPTGSTTNTKPAFSWTATDGVTSYELWATNAATGAQAFRIPNLTSNSFTPTTPLSVGSYTVSVRVTTAFGTSLWSPDYPFTILPPPIPTLTAPTGSTPFVTPTLSWTASSDVARYDLQISNLTSGQTQYIRQQNLTSNSYTPPSALPLGSYQATVQAFNSAGDSGGWSAPLNFTITPPAVPTLTAPTSGSSSASTNPTFTWTSSPGASRYDLWVANQTTGQTQIIRQQNLTTTSFTPSSPLPSGSYQAWVESFNSAGNTLGWSSGISFTLTPPPLPTMTTPTGSFTNTLPTFTWTASTGATHYDLWVANQTTGQTQIIRQQTLTTTSFTPASPLPIGSYQAWVQALNDAGSSAGWSAGISFTIIPVLPPTLTAPTGSITNTLPTFTWTASVGNATRYDLWVANQTTGQGQIIRQQNVTTTSYTPSSPLPAGSYTAWVEAYNGASPLGGWSGGLSFSIVPPPPPAPPTLTGPASVITSTTPTLTWNASDGATQYDVWADNTSTGQSSVIRRTVSATSLTPPNPIPLGQYTVWIRAANSAGFGAWSSGYHFLIDTTAPAVPTFTGPASPTALLAPTLSWSASTGAARYDLWVNNVATGQTVIRQQNLTSNSFTPTANLTVGSYVAWVEAFDNTNQTRGWSAGTSFTISPPAPPSQISPSGTITSTLPAFSWSAVTGAARYDLWVDDVTTGQSQVIRQQNLASNSYTPATALAKGDSYRIWLRALNANGDSSNWSAGVVFTIA